MPNNKRSYLSVLLGRKRFLVALSVLIAVITWMLVSIYESPTVSRVVKNVPITVDDSLPSQLGYQAFGADNLHVDVTVKGKRYEVGDNVLKASDLTVLAKTTYVDTPGKYTLQLKATANDSNADYTITAKSLDYIEVYFDTPRTTEVTLKPKVEYSGPLLYSDDYISKDPVVSQKKVTVYGPATEVDKIDSALAVVKIEGRLRKSETTEASLQFLDKSGAELSYLTCKDAKNVTVTVPVYRETTLPVTVGFSSVPSDYIDNPFSFTISPSEMDVAVDPEKLKNMNEISLGTIDFSKLTSGTNTITMKASDITDGIPDDKDAEFTVTVDTGDVSTDTLTLDLSNLTVKNNKENKKFSLSKDSVTVTVVGPSDDLSKISADDLTASINLAKADWSDGTVKAPITIALDSKTCWVYGSYSVELTEE